MAARALPGELPPCPCSRRPSRLETSFQWYAHPGKARSKGHRQDAPNAWSSLTGLRAGAHSCPLRLLRSQRTSPWSCCIHKLHGSRDYSPSPDSTAPQYLDSGQTPSYSIIFLLRRKIIMNSTTPASAPATTRIKVTLSIVFSSRV